jgi:hypothetical protein
MVSQKIFFTTRSLRSLESTEITEKSWVRFLPLSVPSVVKGYSDQPERRPE